MARAKFRDVVLNRRGEGVAASVTVYQTGTTTLYSPIYNAAGAVIANPITANSEGEFEFYTDAPDRVDLFVQRTGFSDETVTVDVLTSTLDAEDVAFTPGGTISATNVQDAITEAAAEFVAGSHPDLATHDALGLATQAELDAHAATSHGTAHPDLAAHDTLGLATQAELDAHAAAGDPHPGYVTTAEGTTLISNHEGAANPHPTYHTAAEVAADIATHEGASNPHPTYETSAEAQAKVDTHVNDTADAHDATAVSFTPAGTIGATNVQDAIEEVAAEAGAGGHPDLATHDALGLATDTELSNHAADTTSVHGITDTSALETTTGAQTKVDTHVNDAADAHDASAISIADAGGYYTGTEVEAALQEIGVSLDSSAVAARTMRTSGSLTLNSATWANVDTNLDLVLVGVNVGDWVEVGINGVINSDSAAETHLDAVSIVSGSPVNSWTDDAAPDNTHLGTWYAVGSAIHAMGASTIRQIEAGDISGGNVTIRMRYRQGSASNRTLNATAQIPLIFWAQVIAPTGPQGEKGDPGSLVWQGAWDSGTAYAVDDLVEHNGSAYISIQAGTNQDPETEAAFWELVAAKGDTGAAGASTELCTTFAKAGTLTTGTGTFRFYARDSWTITEVRASVGTAPTGATVIVDVNKNGTTIFTTQASRPAIAISGFTDLSASPDVTSLADGDYLTVDIDQVGSTIAGADLTVQVWMVP